VNKRVASDTAFLAKLLPARLATRLATGGAPDPRRILQTPSIVLLADLSNFTTVTERLVARLGPDGADRLSQTLNACFTGMLDAVEQAGGEVLSIGGDAVLAAWYCDEQSAGEEHSAILQAKQALACSELMHRSLAVASPIEGTRLSLHIGLARGLLLTAAVGGVENHFEIVSGGRAMADVYAAVNHAASGSTVVSPQLWQWAKDWCTGTTLGGGYVSLARSATPVLPASKRSAEEVLDAQQLLCFIPDVIAELEHPRLSPWISQPRLVTAFFCRLVGLGLETEAAFAPLHPAIAAIQRAIRQRGGALERAHLDEKGVVVVAFFGLPNSRTSSHALSAIDAALAIDTELRALGRPHALGIATGRSFCGLVGSPRRVHYTCHGDVPNLAARFMAHIEEGIVCDAYTERTTRHAYEFRALQGVSVKGIEASAPAYLLLGARAGRPRAHNAIASPLVGRAREMQAIVEAIADARRSVSRLVILEGEAGIGKSRLALEAAGRAHELGLSALIAHADRGVSDRPYRIWQSIFDQLLGTAPSVDLHAHEQAWRSELGGNEELLALLNPITRLDASESDATSRLSVEARGAKVAALLLETLQRAASRGPMLIVLEDMHWADTASWLLAQEAIRNVPGLALLATRRALSSRPELHDVASEVSASRLVLSHLSRHDTINLVCATLGVSMVSDHAAGWIYGRSQGSPFFVEELARSLRDRGLLDPNRDAGNGGSDADFDAFPLPYNVESAITSRIDHLPIQAQIILKCASVIGTRFSLNALIDVLPPQVRSAEVAESIDALVSGHLLARTDSGDRLSCSFRHQIICRVAYGLVPEVLRRQIHGALAQWYASGLRQGETDWTLIAYHWEKGGNSAEAMDCFERASLQALHVGAHREAANCLERALALAAVHAPQALREAKWRQQLGVCYIALGRLAEGATEARKALRAVGHDLPERRYAWTGFLVLQIFRYVCTPRSAASPPAPSHDPALQSAKVAIVAGAVNAFAEASYFSGDVVALAASNLFAVNLAETAGNPGSASRASAVIGYMLGVSRLHGLARTFFERPRQACRAAGDLTGESSTLGGQIMYEVGFGRWETAREAIARATALCRQTGDPQDIERALTLAGLAAHYRGHFEESYRLFSEVYDSANSRANRQHMAWGAYAMGQNLLPMGRAEAALIQLERAGKLLEGVEDQHSRLIWLGLMGLAYLQLRDYRRALEVTLEAVESARRLPPNNFGSLAGYSGPVVVLIALWGRALRFAPHEAAGLERLAEAAVGRLGDYARLFPIGAPRWLLSRGWLAWYRGQPARARRHWSRCLARSEVLEMRYEQGLAHWALQRMPESAAADQAHREHAIELLDSVKAVALPFEIGDAKTA
jgi:class 3 adenylate cyclase/tetratricopeptide (TPR) repeat protein